MNHDATPHESRSGRVVAVYGAKGGVGCTLIAAGLTMAARRHGRAAIMVQVTESPAAEAELLFPEESEERTAVTLPDPECLSELMVRLPGDAPAVVDCSGGPWPKIKPVLLLADLVLLVATPELLAVRGWRPALDRVCAAGLDPRRCLPVLNRVGVAGGVDGGVLAEVLPGFAFETLPDAPGEVRVALSEGRHLAHSGSWFQAVERLSARVQELLAALPVLPAASGTGSERPVALTGRAKREALQEVLRELGDLNTRLEPSALRRRVTEAAASVANRLADIQLLPLRDARDIVGQLVDEVLGYGVLESLMRDQEVSEVMVNGPEKVYVERRGRVEQVPCQFDSAEEVTRLVHRIISPLGRRVDESSPMVDARLPDGSRLNAVIPPLALDGPLVTIRRFSVKALTLEALVELGTLTPETARHLSDAVRARKNILLSGGTGTGKTTLLNALSACVPAGERIITIEDAAELRLQQDHVVRLEARPPNLEGKGAVSIRDLVRNALRMRPDRLVVGEVRGPEALDMLQAMNTGHSGSMATIHANSATEALSRLETMVLMAGVSLPLKVVRDQVASALDLVVHLERGREGTRYVSEIAAVEGVVSGQYRFRSFALGQEVGEPVYEKGA